MSRVEADILINFVNKYFHFIHNLSHCFKVISTSRLTYALDIGIYGHRVKKQTDSKNCFVFNPPLSHPQASGRVP